MADATKAAIASGDVRFQHAADAISEAQVGMADDTGTQPALAVACARAHSRRAIDEFDFADRLHFDRPSARYIDSHSTKTLWVML
jgi:hypothetical protein